MTQNADISYLELKIIMKNIYHYFLCICKNASNEKFVVTIPEVYLAR